MQVEAQESFYEDDTEIPIFRQRQTNLQQHLLSPIEQDEGGQLGEAKLQSIIILFLSYNRSLLYSRKLDVRPSIRRNRSLSYLHILFVWLVW